MAPAHMDHRRSHVRFEILGRMPGTVGSMERLHVINLGASGALVESALPLPPNAEYQMQLVLDDHVSEATVKVRRVNEVRPDSGALRYRIGLEFLSLSNDAEDTIKRIIAADPADR